MMGALLPRLVLLSAAGFLVLSTPLLAGLGDAEFAAPVPHPQADSVHALVAWLVVCESQLLAALATSTSARPVAIGDHLLGDRLGQGVGAVEAVVFDDRRRRSRGLGRLGLRGLLRGVAAG